MAMGLSGRRRQIRFWAWATSLLLCFLGIMPFGGLAPAHSQSLLELQQTGESLYASGDYQQAAEVFTTILKRNQTGQALAALEYLGASLVRKTPPDYKNAEFFLAKAVEADPHDAASWYDLGVARDHLGQLDGATEAYRNAKQEIDICLNDILPAGLDTPASSNCQQALARVNRPENVYKNLGIAQLSQGEFVAAIETFQSSTALNPQFGDGYYLEGFANTSQADFDSARAAFDRSVAKGVEFDHPEWSYNGRGVANLLDGHPERAVPDFDLAIARAESEERDAFTPYVNRGFAHFKLGEFATAESDYQTVIDRNPKEPNGFYNLGYVRFAIAEAALELSHAEGDVTEAIAKLPQPETTYFQTEIERYARRHQPLWPSDRLSGIFAAASPLLPAAPPPELSDTIAREALAQLATDRLDRSADSFGTAIALRPDYAEAHYGLGVVRRQQGQWPEAKAAFTKAKKYYGERGNDTWVSFVNELDLPALDLRITEPLLPQEKSLEPPVDAPDIVARRDGFGFTQSDIVTAIDDQEPKQLLEIATKNDDWLTRREAVHALRLQNYRYAYPALQRRLSKQDDGYLETNRGVRSAILYFLEEVSPPPPPPPPPTIAIAPRRYVRPAPYYSNPAPRYVEPAYTPTYAEPAYVPPAPSAYVPPPSAYVPPPASVTNVQTHFEPAPSPASVSAGCSGSSIVSQAICRIEG